MTCCGIPDKFNECCPKCVWLFGMLFFQTPYISFLYAREFRQLGISIQSVYQQELKKKISSVPTSDSKSTRTL